MTSTTRLPRYRRAASPPRILLTPRDFQLLQAVADFRMVTCGQLQALLFETVSPSVCKRRLTLLFHNRYLDRRYLPIRSAYGANQAVYCLDSLGAAVLRTETKRQLDWRPRDNNRELYFLEHLVATNSVRASLTVACRRLGLNLDWTDERSLRQERNGPTGVFFDGLALVSGRGVAEAFAIELDRGTVEERQFKTKIGAVQAAWADGSLTERSGGRGLRILFVCTETRRDRRRQERIRTWTEAVGGGGRFWFSSLKELATTNDPLRAAIWEVAKRDGLWPLFAVGSTAAAPP